MKCYTVSKKKEQGHPPCAYKMANNMYKKNKLGSNIEAP